MMSTLPTVFGPVYSPVAVSPLQSNSALLESFALKPSVPTIVCRNPRFGAGPGCHSHVPPDAAFSVHRDVENAPPACLTHLPNSGASADAPAGIAASTAAKPRTTNALRSSVIALPAPFSCLSTA
jgi:hypothetical protein